MQEVRANFTEHNRNTQVAVAAALSAAAERIEILTKKLNQTIGSAGVAMG